MSPVIRRHFNTPDIHSRCKHTSPVYWSQSDGYLMVRLPARLSSIKTLETWTEVPSKPSRTRVRLLRPRLPRALISPVFSFLAPTLLTLRPQSCDWRLQCPRDESLGQSRSFTLIGGGGSFVQSFSPRVGFGWRGNRLSCALGLFIHVGLYCGKLNWKKALVCVCEGGRRLGVKLRLCGEGWR